MIQTQKNMLNRLLIGWTMRTFKGPISFRISTQHFKNTIIWVPEWNLRTMYIRLLLFGINNPKSQFPTSTPYESTLQYML